MPALSFHEWLGNRDREAVAAEKLATLVAQSPAGVSKDCLARTLRLPPEILDDLLRALVTTGQVTMLKVGGRTVYRAAGRRRRALRFGVGGDIRPPSGRLSAFLNSGYNTGVSNAARLAMKSTGCGTC